MSKKLTNKHQNNSFIFCLCDLRGLILVFSFLRIRNGLFGDNTTDMDQRIGVWHVIGSCQLIDKAQISQYLQGGFLGLFHLGFLH